MMIASSLMIRRAIALSCDSRGIALNAEFSKHYASARSWPMVFMSWLDTESGDLVTAVD
jgi:hypothetical protein